MRSYFAVHGEDVFQGGWVSVYLWAKQRTATNEPVKILTARGGEKNARIIAEVTLDNVRIIGNGRVMSRKLLNGKS